MDDKLVAILEGAGLDKDLITEELLGGLRESLQVENEGAAEVAEMKKKLDEMEKRRREQDQALSRKDLELKAAVEKLQKAPAQEPMTSTANASANTPNLQAILEKEVAPMRELIQQMADAQRRQAAELEAERASRLRREAIDALADEIPVLKDPKYQALMPQTTDVEQLKSFGQTLSELAKATETQAYQRIRDGHVPASVPPRVSPGNEGEFQAEMKRIRALEQSGQMTPQDASAKIQELARLMKPE